MTSISGFSSITPQTGNTLPQTAPTASQTLTEAQTNTGTSSPNLIPVNFGLSGFSGLGTSQPRSPEDTAALLAAIALALEETVGETRNNRTEALGSGLRTALGDFLGRLNSLTALATRQTEINGEIATTTAERDAKVSQRDTLQNQSAGLGSQINALNGQIASLDQQIAAARAAKQPTGALEAQRAAKISERDGLAQQKAGVDQQIATLNGEIDALNGKLTALQNELAANIAQFASIQSTLLNVFLQASLTVLDLEADDQIVNEERDLKVRVTLEEIAEQLDELGEDTTIREALTEFVQESRLTREREDDVARTALALVTAITDVLATLASLDLPQDSELGKSAAQSRGRVRVAL